MSDQATPNTDQDSLSENEDFEQEESERIVESSPSDGKPLNLLQYGTLTSSASQSRTLDDFSEYFLEPPYNKLPETVQDVLNMWKLRHRKHTDEVYLKYFWKILIVVALFYSLPSIQFVIYQYKHQGELYCYYNFKCAKEFAGIKAFNNVISNIGYLICGAFFMCFVFLTQRSNSELGLHRDKSLYYTIALCIIFEGIFSALYHVCPSRLNFQFDTTFMIVGGGLLFITLYQKRHPTFAPGAVKTYACFAVLILLNCLSLLDVSPIGVWVLYIISFSVISIGGSLHLYYHRRWELSRQIFRRLWHILTFFPRPLKQKSRFATLLVVNIVSFLLSLLAAVEGIKNDDSSTVSNVMLAVIILNAMTYLFYYLGMKIYNYEHVKWQVWALMVLMIVSWTIAIYFFEDAVTDKFLSRKESEALNQPCALFDYFDYHDIWHFCSAIGLTAIMLAVYIVDFDLKNTPRNKIKVF